MVKPKIFSSLLLIDLSFNTFSQSRITHEIGVIAEPIEFRSDYGQRNNSKTNSKNMGFEIAIVDYLNFSYTDYVNNYFAEHFKVRNELSYIKANLNHYGEWTEKELNGFSAVKSNARHHSII